MKRGERKRVCKRGHSLTDPQNVRLEKRGHAVCRACKRLASRRDMEATVDAPVINDRWTDDELATVADRSLTAMAAAHQLGRTVSAVRTMRARLHNGWVPDYEPPLTEFEVDFIRSSPGLTAERIAEELNRPYALVTKARRQLIASEGAHFGTGPYDKSPHMVGNRLLLAKTCSRCGIIRGGAEFHKTKKDIGRHHPLCRYCRAETRDRWADKESHELLEARVRELSETVGPGYLSRLRDEYAKADVEILSRDDLTTCEKAARLGRSYAAVTQAMHVRGLSESREERREPGGVWIIELASA